MMQFEVRFLKDICDSTGHPHTVVQRAIFVNARNHEEALVVAKAMFCETERIANWTIRASACDARPCESQPEDVRHQPGGARPARRIVGAR